MPAGRLDVTVLGAKNLKNTQLLGAQDPFFVVTVGKKHFTSATASDSGQNPTWNARYSFDTRDEDKICFTIRNRNTLTADSHIGDVVISLHTVYTEGKHDAVVQVLRGSGRPQGEFSVILLFTPYDSQKRKSSTPTTPQTKPITPSSPPGYPIGASPPSGSTGFAANPGMPSSPVPTAPPPPGFPVGTNVAAAPQQTVGANVVAAAQHTVGTNMVAAPQRTVGANVVAAPQHTVSYMPVPQTAQMHVPSGYYSPPMQPQSPIAIVPQAQIQTVQYPVVPSFVQTPQFPPQMAYLPAQPTYNGGYPQTNYPATPPGGLPPNGFQ